VPRGCRIPVALAGHPTRADLAKRRPTARTRGSMRWQAFRSRSSGFAMEHGQVWEEYARAEPYWSVLTEERFVRAQLTEERRTAFFAPVRQHVAGLLAMLRRHFETSFPPRRVLDFGSGAGRLAIPFAELGAEVLGLDVSPSMVAEAERNA